MKRPSKEALSIAQHFIKKTGIDTKSETSKTNIHDLAISIDELVKQKTPKQKRKERERILPFAAFIKYGKAGDVFYSEKADKDCTAYASNYSAKIKTERLRTVPAVGLQMQNIVKITLI